MTLIADLVAMALNCARILEETQLALPSASHPEMADGDPVHIRGHGGSPYPVV